MARRAASAPVPSRVVRHRRRTRRPAARADRGPTLGIALGEAGIAAGLVFGTDLVGDRAWCPVAGADPARWRTAVLQIAARFAGRHDRVGLAVGATARSTLGLGTLHPDDDQLVRLGREIGAPIVASGMVEATAWAEHRRGAGAGRDMAYLDVGARVDGALVIGARLVTGHRGTSVRTGLMPVGPHGSPIEDSIDARSIARLAEGGGPPIDAAGVLAAARAHELWAEMVLETSALHLTQLCTMLRWLVDPEVIVIGGEVGGTEEYVTLVRKTLPGVDRAARSMVVPAALGADAALLGAAGLAQRDP